jgi:hypothetical protein
MSFATLCLNLGHALPVDIEQESGGTQPVAAVLGTNPQPAEAGPQPESGVSAG